MPEPLLARSLDEVREAFPVLRQSILAHFDQCPLALKFDLEGFPYMSAEAARGVVFHRFAEKYLRELVDRRERNMPSAEALEVLYEAAAQVDVPDEDVVHVPSEEREILRIAAIKFSANLLAFERIVAIEERLFADVQYVDANGELVTRTVTGKPDVLIADPERMGVVVPDWKTTRQPPPRKAVPGKDDPLSPEGYFQQKLYAFLVFRSYPKVETVTMREYYPVAGEAREAHVERWQLEHVEREVALAVQELDRALAAGSGSPLWMPQPGRWCRYCPRPNDCPVDKAERPIPAPLDAQEASEWAGAYLVADRRRSYLREALRERVSEHGPIDVQSEKGDYQLRWRIDSAGRRNFGLWPREEDVA